MYQLPYRLTPHSATCEVLFFCYPYPYAGRTVPCVLPVSQHQQHCVLSFPPFSARQKSEESAFPFPVSEVLHCYNIFVFPFPCLQ